MRHWKLYKGQLAFAVDGPRPSEPRTLLHRYDVSCSMEHLCKFQKSLRGGGCNGVSSFRMTEPIRTKELCEKEMERIPYILQWVSESQV